MKPTLLGDVLQHVPVELGLGEDPPRLDDAHRRHAQVGVGLAHELGQPLVAVAQRVLVQEVNRRRRTSTSHQPTR
jgi:hypothetical protein